MDGYIFRESNSPVSSSLNNLLFMELFPMQVDPSSKGVGSLEGVYLSLEELRPMGKQI